MSIFTNLLSRFFDIKSKKTNDEIIASYLTKKGYIYDNTENCYMLDNYSLTYNDKYTVMLKQDTKDVFQIPTDKFYEDVRYKIFDIEEWRYPNTQLCARLVVTRVILEDDNIRGYCIDTQAVKDVGVTIKVYDELINFNRLHIISDILKTIQLKEFQGILCDSIKELIKYKPREHLESKNDFILKRYFKSERFEIEYNKYSNSRYLVNKTDKNLIIQNKSDLKLSETLNIKDVIKDILNNEFDINTHAVNRVYNTAQISKLKSILDKNGYKQTTYNYKYGYISNDNIIFVEIDSKQNNVIFYDIETGDSTSMFIDDVIKEIG